MNSTTKILAAVGACAVTLLPVPTQAEERLPVTVALTQVATAQAPTAGATGPDGSLWVGQRSGAVRVLTGQGLGAPVLTVQTTTDGERGLAGITFDQDFSHFYVSYTNLQGHNTIEEFDVVDGQVQVDTRRPEPRLAARQGAADRPGRR